MTIKLSFCISIMNRLYQLKQTLRKNLDDNVKFKNDIDFILVDFNSNDDIINYIKTNFKNELEDGYLKFYHTKDLQYWKSPVAKNTTHQLSDAKFICNLDCDNYVGKDGAKILLDCIKNNDENILIHQSSNIFGYGNMGRITLSKNNFLNLGGYDESLLPMSHQDGDLVNRAKIYGLKYININDSEYNKTIKNSKEESIKNCYGNLDYVKMMKINNLISNFNIKTKRIKANNYTNKLKIGLLENIIKIK